MLTIQFHISGILHTYSNVAKEAFSVICIKIFRKEKIVTCIHLKKKKNDKFALF